MSIEIVTYEPSAMQTPGDDRGIVRFYKDELALSRQLADGLVRVAPGDPSRVAKELERDHNYETLGPWEPYMAGMLRTRVRSIFDA